MLHSGPGYAELRVGAVRGRSMVLRSCSRNPLRLLTPRAQGTSVWAYTSSFGGGMVAGDKHEVLVHVDPGATCFLTTQSSTKIYKSLRGAECSQMLSAHVGAEGMLISVPDPVQCFAQAHYRQAQRFDLAPAANLVMVDWLSAGRAARGEHWAFERYSTRTEIRRQQQLIFCDAVTLEGASAGQTGGFMTGGYHCLATLVVLGPQFAADSSAMLSQVQQQPIRSGANLAVSISPLREGLVMRLMGSSVETVGRALDHHLQFCKRFLQDDPWARKW